MDYVQSLPRFHGKTSVLIYIAEDDVNFYLSLKVVSKPPLRLNPPKADKSLCWTEPSNARNIPDIPAVGRLSPPFYPAGF
jgi:hypothetical protein